MKTYPRLTLICLALGLFILSFIGFIHPTLNHLMWFFILIGIFLLSLIKIEVAAYAILAELAIGGQGYLFSLPIAGFPVSLRIGLFGVAGVAFVYHLIRKRRMPRIASTKFAIPFLLIVLFVVFGTIRGYLNNDALLNFFDANAYVSLLYIPIFVEAFYRPIHLTKALTVFLSFSVALALASIGLLGLYATSHYDNSLLSAASLDDNLQQQLSEQQSWGQGVVEQRIGPDESQFVYDPTVITKTKPESYRWLRATGTAEISYISGRFFRVFSASHIVMIFVLFSAFSLLWQKQTKKIKTLLMFSVFVMIVSLFISYSRSLWLGAGLASIVFVFVWFKQTVHRQRMLLYLLFCIALFASLYFFTGIGDSITSRVTSIFHPTTEVASTHRIELGKALLTQISEHPFLGTGFGTLVSFPTVLPSGEIITASFYIYEWSYLDIAVKIGLIGLCFFLLLFAFASTYLVKKYLQTNIPIYFGIFTGFLACLIANVTTPIFTHPLGFGLLALAVTYSLHNYERTNSTRNVE